MTKVDWGMIGLNGACLVGTLVAPADAAVPVGLMCVANSVYIVLLAQKLHEVQQEWAFSVRLSRELLRAEINRTDTEGGER